MTMLDPAVAAACERADRDAWLDFCRAAPSEVAAACGVAVAEIGTAVAGQAALVDVLAFNRVVGLGIDTPAEPAHVDAAIQFYTAAAVPRWFVQVGAAAQPADLAARLAARGLRHYNNWVKLYRATRAPMRPTPVPGPRVQQIGPADAQTAAEIMCRAFGFPEIVVPWAAAVVGRPGWRHYLAYQEHRAVGTAALFVTGDVGWLGFAGTAAEARGRGAQSELIVRRMVDAAALGCEWLVVETAEEREDRPVPSLHNLVRLGFELAYLRPNYIWATAPPA